MTRTSRRRFLPHPVLSLVLAAVWILLMNDLSAGGLALGLLLGWAIPLLTSAYWPETPRIRSPWRLAEYCAVALWDIVVANIEVAYLVVFRRARDLKPAFIAVPLDIRTPEAIAVLAGTITMTPGTVTSDLSSDGRVLLVHALNVTDREAAVAGIKQRYEARLKEIFE